MRTSLAALVVAVSSLVACGDDTAGSGGSGGGATSQGGGTGQGGDTGQGGEAGGSTTAGTGGDGNGGGGTGGSAACPAIAITDGTPAECAEAGPLALAVSGEVACTPGDVSVWPAQLFEVEVEAGDCLFMRADDVGAPAGSDLFGALIDPGGKSTLLDDETECSVGGPEGPGCPAGGITIEESGVAIVVVGGFESEGCPLDGSTPFTLAVSVSGADVEPAALCTGDLLEIIPD